MKADQPKIDPAAYSAPSPVAHPIEERIALATIRRTIVVGPVIVLFAWAVSGNLGAVSAAIGVGIVAVNFWLSGFVLSRAAARSMRAYHAAALLGFFTRLGLITLSMFLVAAVFEVDRPALGIAAVVAYLTLLVWEAWALTRSPGREYEWTS